MSKTLTFINDSTARQLLLSLSKSEILSIQSLLADSLRSFSTGPEREFQPEAGVVVRPDGQKTLFRPFTSPSSVGTKIIVDPAPNPSSPNGSRGPLRGIIAVCSNEGHPTGILDAEELTGFRTTLSALIPFCWRKRVERILVFGAGKQALWHVRLALALRGEEVGEVVLTNRSAKRGEEVVERLRGEEGRSWRSGAGIRHLRSDSGDYHAELERELGTADVVFCTVPSMKALFDGRMVGGDSGRLPLITAIGSWRPDMMEVDPGLIRRIVESEDGFNPRGFGGGAIIVDDRMTVMKDAGEVVESKVSQEALVEVGEILEMQAQKDGKMNEPLQEWLQNGLVVYKSVGVGITDLIAANAMLEHAKKQGLGITLPNE